MKKLIFLLLFAVLPITTVDAFEEGEWTVFNKGGIVSTSPILNRSGDKGAGLCIDGQGALVNALGNWISPTQAILVKGPRQRRKQRFNVRFIFDHKLLEKVAKDFIESNDDFLYLGGEVTKVIWPKKDDEDSVQKDRNSLLFLDNNITEEIWPKNENDKNYPQLVVLVSSIATEDGNWTVVKGYYEPFGPEGGAQKTQAAVNTGNLLKTDPNGSEGRYGLQDVDSKFLLPPLEGKIVVITGRSDPKSNYDVIWEISSFDFLENIKP